MKPLVPTLLAIALTLPAAAQQPTAAPPSAPPPVAALPSVTLPPELDRVLRDYETAWRARDAKALSELFAEDGFVLANGQAPVRGRPAIQVAYTGAGGPLVLRAFAFGASGDVGYILGGYAGAAGPDDGKFTLTLVRDAGGRWLIQSDMDNPNQRRGG
jgi:ketosteroid isomerase-like protein